jgi:hypothetical protein
MLAALLAGGSLARGQVVTPTSITITPDSPIFSGGNVSNLVQLCLPPGTTINKVDVFLLMDDTGSFANYVTTITNIFANLVTSLEAAVPGVEFGFGVGRFEDFGGPGTTFSLENLNGRPFILNQPIVTAATAGGTAARNALINAALSHTAPGFGGDNPEASLCEGLYQTATGVGFDGDGNGSELDSGPAGALATQISPGNSGDVPPFSSNVLLASGTLGGAGYRADALHLVLLATDVAPVAPFPAGQPVPAVITNGFGFSVPTSALLYSTTLGISPGRYGFVSNSKSLTNGNTVANAVAPAGSGTVQGTVNALNALGIRVICMGPGAAPTNSTTATPDPSTWFSAMGRLTGAVDGSGNPLVFSTSVSLGTLTTSIVNNIATTTTLPVNISLAPAPSLPPGFNLSFSPLVVSNVAPGNCASFTAVFSGTSAKSGSFNLDFVTVGSGSVLGSIPVTVVAPTMAPPNLLKNNVTTGAEVMIGEVFSYQISFNTFSNNTAAVGLQIVDQLPLEEDFISATSIGALSSVYDPISHTIVWDFGTWPPLTAGPTNTVTVRLNANARGETNVVNVASLITSNLPPIIIVDTNSRCRGCTGINVCPPPQVSITPVANRGYYQLVATSTCYAASQLQFYIHDTASAFVAGPYPSGMVVKIKKSAATGIGPASGPASVTIMVLGDGQVYAVDPGGQISLVTTCKSL